MPVRLGLIGAAHMHVEYILDEVARRADVEIVAVCDADQQRRAKLAESTSAPAYDSIEKLLAEHRIDAAAVTTEPGLRSAVVTRLLEAGIFTIVDKPLATTLEGLNAIETALAGRPLLTLLLEKRHYAVTSALKQILAEGAVGEVVTITATGPHKLRAAQRPDWYFQPALYGGILTDLAVHDVDLALWLTGHHANRVRGWISPVTPTDHPSFALAGRAMIETDRGAEITVDVDWLQPDASAHHGDYAMRISGTLGRADVDFARNTLTIETAVHPAFQQPLQPGQPPARYAFDHLAKGLPLSISSADSLRATRLALLAQQSASNGGVWLAA